MRVVSLHRYPIKGCRGTALDRAEFDAHGIVGDRRLMLVDAQGRFLSQREVPALATITPVLDGSSLTVECAGWPTLPVALDPGGRELEVRVWGDTMLAVDQGDRAAAWFSAVVAAPVRLVQWGARSRRPVDPHYAPRLDAETAFTDGYPALLTLEASLADLNARLAEAVPMARFRPSIVVRGGAPWAEDGFRGLRIGAMLFDAVKPCARCVVTTTDQASGRRHPAQEPLRTLATFRTIPRLGAIFGQNLVHRAPGVIAVGDPVEGA